MIPDVYAIADYYKEYFSVGGGYGNLLSFGCFDGYKELGTLYLDHLVYTDGITSIFSPENITEEIDYAWYKEEENINKPYEDNQDDDMSKPGAYSWVKAPRYNNLPFETGPLARQWLTGEYRNGISTMDRTIAKVLEARKIVAIINTLLENLIPDVSVQGKYSIPDIAIGKGLVDTTRGALGHWLKVDNQVISFYQLITPSAWNLSTRSSNNRKGTAEQALIGTPISDINAPVEIGRIIRSFDPCISCATHVYTEGECVNIIKIVH